MKLISSEIRMLRDPQPLRIFCAVSVCNSVFNNNLRNRAFRCFTDTLLHRYSVVSSAKRAFSPPKVGMSSVRHRRTCLQRSVSSSVESVL